MTSFRCTVGPSPVLSERAIGRTSALLWTAGAVMGVLACLVPHGPHVAVAGWWAVSGLAAAVALVTWVRGAYLPLALQYVQSVVACGAVSLAALSARHSPALLAVGTLYVLTTVYAAGFYARAPLLLYLVCQTVASGVILLSSGAPGAPAAWVVVNGTATAAGMVVHALVQALVRAAEADPLTGLPNRRAVEAVLRRELAGAHRRRAPLCLAMVDLDGFKEVNDELGHGGGDRVLRRVAAAWAAQVRAADVLGRVGGDEFVLVLPGSTVADAATAVERLAASDPQRFSAGIAAASPADGYDELMARADAACYRAKRGGCRVEVAPAAPPLVPLPGGAGHQAS